MLLRCRHGIGQRQLRSHPVQFSTRSANWTWAAHLTACTRRHLTHVCSAAISPPGTADVNKNLRLAVIGDVHDAWGENDAVALKSLKVDLAIFVGDFGNENVDVVRSVAQLDHPKAVILGNHDAWYTLTPRGLSRRKKYVADSATNQLHGDNKVRQQLAALGPAHVGYSALQVEGKAISVVGARPFSKGGADFHTVKAFCQEYLGVDSSEASVRRITSVASSRPASHSLILIGHNAPTGLGNKRHDICGIDWESKAGDHGDPDFRAALDRLQQQGRHIPLVLFGHMHESLMPRFGGGLRRMVHVDQRTGTVCLNCAIVPRIRPSSLSKDGRQLRAHHFSIVDMRDGEVMTAHDVWVEVDRVASAYPHEPDYSADDGAVDSSNSPVEVVPGVFCRVVADRQVLRTLQGAHGTVKLVWDGHNREWTPVVLQSRGGTKGLTEADALDKVAAGNVAAAVGR